MRTYNICLLGFGNVGQALVRLLERKAAALRAQHGIEWRLTGVASRRLGWIAQSAGLDTAALLRGEGLEALPHTRGGVGEWLAAAQADVLCEVTSLVPEHGEPAVSHLRAALEHGAHALTANKGPVVHAYSELRDLAAARGKRFLFESTVMDGCPIFSLFRETLPVTELRAFRGLLNATTGVILGEMEAGKSFAEGVRRAQELGIAETDPSADVDGWDGAVKISALVQVLMDLPLPLQAIERTSMGGLSTAEVQAARAVGTPYKMVCRAERRGDTVVASVRPERVPPGDPLGALHNESMLVHFETDTLTGLTITSHEPTPETTAYGLLADFVTAVRGA